jgi:hypothetical protein
MFMNNNKKLYNHSKFQLEECWFSKGNQKFKVIQKGWEG